MSFSFHSVPVVLQLVSFALLLVATITAPATKVLSLAQQGGIRYGTLGYCVQGTDDSDWQCSKAAANYAVTSLGTANDWVFGDSARDSLSKILIVIPIACFFALISFLMAIVSHFVESKTFFLLELVVLVISFLLAALVCVVDFLLFYPHVTYGSWILIPAAVWPLVSVVFIVLAIAFKSRNDGYEESDEDENHIEINKIDNFNSFNAVPPPPEIKDDDVDDFTDEKHYDAYKTTTKSVNDDSYFESKSNTHENVAPTDFTNNFLPPMPQNVNNSQYMNNSVPSFNNHKTTPYPTGDEFNFTPVPQPGFQNVNNSNNSFHSAQDFQQVSSSQPLLPKQRQPHNTSGSVVSNNSVPYGNRMISAQSHASQSRMASSVYPDAMGFGTSPVGNNAVSPQKNLQNNYMDEDGYYKPEDDDGFETNSDFTSVSQRPTNPLYYQNLQGNNNNNNYNNQYNQPPPSQHQQYQQPPPQQFNRPPPRKQQGPSKSDILLNSNPEFSLQGARPRPAFQRPTGRTNPGYKRPGQTKPNILTPASLGGDSPYNLR